MITNPPVIDKAVKLDEIRLLSPEEKKELITLFNSYGAKGHELLNHDPAIPDAGAVALDFILLQIYSEHPLLMMFHDAMRQSYVDYLKIMAGYISENEVR